MNSRGLVVFVMAAAACIHSPGCSPEGGTLPPLSSWRVLPAAAIEWPCAASSRVEWTVLKRNGGVQAVPGLEVSDRMPLFLWPHLAGAAHVQAVQDGYLIGFDAGEFGGAAWWFSRYGRRRTKLTVPPPSGADYYPENVHGFVPFGPDYLAFQGLAHMGIDEGRVIRVARASTGGWSATPFATLPDSPDAALAETENSWLFVSSSGIWRIDAEARLSTVWRPETVADISVSERLTGRVSFSWIQGQIQPIGSQLVTAILSPLRPGEVLSGQIIVHGDQTGGTNTLGVYFSRP